MQGTRKALNHEEVEAHELAELGYDLMGCIFDSSQPNSRASQERFKANYGYDENKCSIIWNYLVRSHWTELERSAKPIHLLWTLLYMKSYGTERKAASELGIDEKTLRKWAWFIMEGISELAPCFVSSS